MPADEDQVTGAIIGAAIEVHRHIKPGSFEAIYHHCLAWELEQRSLRIRRQVGVPLVYKGIRFDLAYRVDLLVEERVVVEVKSVERILPIHESQIVTYLTLMGVRTGLLLNFNVPLMRDGVRRFVV